jgi:hypothetical protein
VPTVNATMVSVQGLASGTVSSRFAPFVNRRKIVACRPMAGAITVIAPFSKGLRNAIPLHGPRYSRAAGFMDSGIRSARGRYQYLAGITLALNSLPLLRKCLCYSCQPIG